MSGRAFIAGGIFFLIPVYVGFSLAPEATVAAMITPMVSILISAVFFSAGISLIVAGKVLRAIPETRDTVIED